jgi:hypothetical protein
MDEAHHCYREKPDDADEEDALKGDDRKEAERNKEAARVWIAGLEAVNRTLGVTRVFDLSATPFFLSGSGYPEGTLFPWTMSDFSLMDAIECGIVKLPRVPVRETVKEIVVPVYVQAETPKKTPQPAKAKAKPKPIFADVPDADILSYGVPAEWLNDVKKATDETLLALTEHLPAEASEALLELATGASRARRSRLCRPRVRSSTRGVVLARTVDIELLPRRRRRLG